MEVPAYLGEATPSVRNILLLAGVLRTWPASVARDLYYMLQSHQALDQQRVLSRLLHVAASLQLGRPDIPQLYTHL